LRGTIKWILQWIPQKLSCSIGVVYNPEQELFGNYVPTILPKRYDAFIFLDQTNALHPIQIPLDRDQIPETYPFGM
jgi:hypothetical protein